MSQRTFEENMSLLELDESTAKLAADRADAKKKYTRPRGLEPWMIDVVERGVSKGMPLQTTAGLIGVSRQTLDRWREKGHTEGAEEIYVEFAMRVESARADANKRGVQNLEQLAVGGSVQAQMELLKAQDPDTWAPKATKLDVTVTPGKQFEEMSDAKLLLMQKIEEASAEEVAKLLAASNGDEQ